MPRLLPFVSTPSAVIPVLVGGADLMIPGVVQHLPSLKTSQLVSVTEYTRDASKLGPPLAVGRMAVDASVLTQDGAKGKAVNVLHTWKDHLFDMGSKGEPPEPETINVAESPKNEPSSEQNPEEESSQTNPDEAGDEPLPSAEPLTPEPQSSVGEESPTLSKEEVSNILRSSLLQAISATLSSLPASSYPIPASTFYSTYILPSRPAFISLPPPSTPVDIKHSSHKSLTTFLKTSEKEGLLKIKEMKNDVLVLGVIANHPEVKAHRRYTTLKDVETKKGKQEQRAEAERTRVHELEVRELWKPHQQSLKFFTEGGFDKSALYSFQDIKTTLAKYVTDRQLTNSRDQSYVNVDELLRSTISSKSDTPETTEFLKREEIIRRLAGKMQNWYEIHADGQDPVVKKGELKPISVVVKIRQGRKASTLITNFEPFFLAAEDVAEELRKLCASATSVSPMLGKNAGLEVLVQGKQIKAVTDFLISRGVPKKWIESADLSGTKK